MLNFGSRPELRFWLKCEPRVIAFLHALALPVFRLQSSSTLHIQILDIRRLATFCTYRGLQQTLRVCTIARSLAAQRSPSLGGPARVISVVVPLIAGRTLLSRALLLRCVSRLEKEIVISSWHFSWGLFREAPVINYYVDDHSEC